MCPSRARVICMCANPHIIMCFEHIRNHTGGRSFDRLRSFEAHQNQQLIRLAMKAITSMMKHAASATVYELQGQAEVQIKKLYLSVETQQ